MVTPEIADSSPVAPLLLRGLLPPMTSRHCSENVASGLGVHASAQEPHAVDGLTERRPSGALGRRGRGAGPLLREVRLLGVGDEGVDRHDLDGPGVGRREQDPRGAAGFVGLEPPRGTHAPAVTR